jgi:putative membrane protein
MKRLAYLAGLAGLLGLTVLIAHQGVADLARVMMRGGWPLFLLVPLHALPLLLDTQAWRTLLLAGVPGRANLAFLWWVASVREAVARLLPSFGIGGELVGLRLARRRLPDTTAIAATIVIEILLTLFSQYLFALAGVLMLPAATQSGARGWAVVAGLLLSLPVPILFGLSLRDQAVFARLERVALRLFGTAATLDGVKLDACIHALLSRRSVLLKSLGWQLAGLLLGTLEVWFALARLGHPVSVGEALAIEALTQAARHAAFFVPAGLGVQEAVVLLLGESLGVSPDISLSLALVKRARELLFGIPALLSWQWVEWGQWRVALWRRR